MKQKEQKEVSNGAVKKSISFPGRMLRDAEKRAQADRRSFSNYIQRLIADDIERSNGRKPVAA